MYCYTIICVPVSFFESFAFRRDSNEAKAVFISEYYLICPFVIGDDAPITSQVSRNVVSY